MGGPTGAPVTGFSSLFSGARGDWSPLVAHPMPSGAGPGVRVQEVPQFPDVFRDSAIAM